VAGSPGGALFGDQALVILRRDHENWNIRKHLPQFPGDPHSVLAPEGSQIEIAKNHIDRAGIADYEGRAGTVGLRDIGERVTGLPQHHF